MLDRRSKRRISAQIYRYYCIIYYRNFPYVKSFIETHLYETGAKLLRRYGCRSSGEKRYIRTRISLEELQKEEKCSQYTQNSQEKG
jgi:hypothetical protein